MIAIFWRYEVRSEHRARFEAAYKATGEWAALLGRTEGFEGTTLLRGEDDIYLTLDHWRSRDDFDSFLEEHGADYRALDQLTEGWTRFEERIGIFELVG